MALINRCRLYLQVITVADIASADGKQIVPWVKDGFRHKDRYSTLNWPTQARPPLRDWKLWRQALSQIEERGLLIEPLGEWTDQSHQTWHGFVDPLMNFYERSGPNNWHKFKPLIKPSERATRASRALWYDGLVFTVSNAPDGLCPATKFTDSATQGDLFTVSHSASELIPLTTTTQRPTLISHPFYSRLVGPLENEAEYLKNLAAAASIGQLHACCDGGYDPIHKKASHGWVIADSFGSPLWEGAGPVDGVPSQLNPFRAELCGLLVILHLLLQLETYHNTLEVSITIYCDNLKAVR